MSLHYIAPQRWRLALVGYVLGGAALGVFNFFLRMAFQRSGVRPGYGTALDVNVLLPLLAIGLAWAYPRLRVIWPGMLLMVICFNFAGAVVNDPAFWNWTFAKIQRYTSPIMVGAWIGCEVLGTIVAGICWSRGRHVKAPDPAKYCSCGYPIFGLAQPRCPECGSVIEQTRLDAAGPPDMPIPHSRH